MTKLLDTKNYTHQFGHRHLLGIAELSPHDIEYLLDRADEAVSVSRQVEKRKLRCVGERKSICFLKPPRAPQSSFELAGKRLGADVMNMSVASSSVKKGETLIDTAMTLNACSQICWWYAIMLPVRLSCLRKKLAARLLMLVMELMSTPPKRCLML